MSESSTGTLKRYALLALLGVGGIGVVAVISAFVSATGSDAPPRLADGAEQLADEWSGEGAEPVRLRLDGSSGPTWVRDDGGKVELAPASTERSVDWERVETSDGHRLVGTADDGDTALQYEWLFRSGDPQARFTIRIPEIDVEKLRSDSFSTSFELPTGELQALGRRLQPRSVEEKELPHRVGPMIPQWLQWRSAGRTVTLDGWTGDGWSLREGSDGESLRLELHVWRPERHPAVQNCSDPSDDGTGTVALEAAATVTFAAAPRVVPSIIPEGEAAGAIPIFDAPEAHPDATFHGVRPDDPEDWTARAKTLAYGHSDSSDPRYGNGGLLGHDLGGTVVVPSKWADTDSVRSFARATADSGVDVAVRGARELPGDGEGRPLSSTLVAEEPHCGALFGAEGTATPSIAVPDFREFRGTFDAESLYTATGPAPSSARPYRLDGSRSELLDSALSSDLLRTLIDHRDVAAFATPLVGSRDPLVPAAKEALLKPERHGAWTVSPPFAESLANLSILRETEPIWVGSLSEWSEYWKRTRNARRRWTPEGDLRLRASGEEGVRGFTLLVGGAHLSDEDVAVEGADRVALRRGTAPTARAERARQTWMSWDLEPGESTRVRFGPDSPVSAMPPVRWTFVD